MDPLPQLQPPPEVSNDPSATTYPAPPKTPAPGGITTFILVIGAPGAGKGTLCKKHPVERGYAHLSVGDYLRELCTDGAERTNAQRGGLSVNEIKEAMKQTNLLAAAPLVEIIRQKVLQLYEEGKRKFIIDGFPRTLESAKLFDTQIMRPSMVIHISCKKATAKAHFLARQREAGDSEAKFDARYARYLEKNAAILERYEESIFTIDTDNSEAESHKAMLSTIERADLLREKAH